MADDLFLGADAIGMLTEYVGTYVGVGIAIGIVIWMLGAGIYVIYDIMRGG